MLKSPATYAQAKLPGLWNMKIIIQSLDKTQAAGDKRCRGRNPSACVSHSGRMNFSSLTFPSRPFERSLPKLCLLKRVYFYASSISQHTWWNAFPCYLLPIKQHLFCLYLHWTKDLGCQMQTSARLRPEQFAAAIPTRGCSSAAPRKLRQRGSGFSAH